MTLFVFAGPSLTAADRARYPDADWRPPAEAGDLLRLSAVPNDVVCLVDGYFDHRPAVRHKELLLLLSRGVVIYGAGSIGALRAAEMESLGMAGVGAIFRAYSRGRLCADDEVALVHGPAAWDWKPLSLPLVDCRASLCRALRSRAIEANEARGVLHAAKSIHYADRDWPAVLERSGIGQARQRVLTEHLAAFPSQKRIDALACIEAASAGAVKPQAPPAMVMTSLLRALARDCGLEPIELSSAPAEAAREASPAAPHPGTGGG